MYSSYKEFLEAHLTLAELGKVRRDDIRGNILIKKLKDHDPLTLNTGGEVKIDKMKDGGEWSDIDDETIGQITDDEGNYDPDKAGGYFAKGVRYQKVLKDDKGDDYQLNQLKKTTEFGSSGAGRLIRQFETVQAIFLAIKQSNYTEMLTPDNLLEFYQKYVEDSKNQRLLFTPDNVKINRELIDDFIEDDDWVTTFCKISNEMWKDDTHLDRSKKYAIYQLGYKGKSPINTLLEKYKSLSKKGEFTDINFAKWCPADVFLIEHQSVDKINDEILNCDSIDVLTSLCDEIFDARLFIPISLKKISKSGKLLIITNKEKEKELPNFYIRKFMIGSDLRGIGSKIKTSSVWKYRDRKDAASKRRNMNFDSSDTGKPLNVDGEVEGSTSRHGKISFRSTKRIIDAYRVHAPDMTELQEYDELSELPDDLLENMIEDIIEIMADNQKYVEAVPLRRGRDIKGNSNKLISRLQSLQIVLAMMELKEVDTHLANECVTKLMRYALSIQTDKFDTPRYLRIL